MTDLTLEVLTAKKDLLKKEFDALKIAESKLVPQLNAIQKRLMWLSAQIDLMGKLKKELSETPIEPIKKELKWK